MTRPNASEIAAELNASDPLRYSKPQPKVADYCTETSFLVYDYVTGQTTLVPRSMYPELSR